ncbi:hypothetical protein QRD89_17760 [Halobacillus sp. ACCC02827]|uniref:DUF6933 domain-containing protein n=1 Tax=Halobacillus sp. ACCC02827 TaxID=3052090 RepID=UPI002571244B|nr:hypothetical protein [Halobacillus sp. ACCC02827]WJE15545.1 hypothetical protein QRD89_17760 [Halobacillus sp. ACCC02827]
MFVIGATKKLQNEIDKPIQDVEAYKEVPEIHQWHANLVTFNRRKCLILVNNATGLNLTLFGLRKPQFDHLDTVIKGSLKQLFQLLEIDESVGEEMLRAADEIVYTKTKNRRVIGIMNDLKSTMEHQLQGQAYEDIDAQKINEENNKMPFRPLEHTYPYKTFIKYFQNQ